MNLALLSILSVRTVIEGAVSAVNGGVLRLASAGIGYVG